MRIELCKTKHIKLWFKKTIIPEITNVVENSDCFMISDVYKITTRKYWMYIHTTLGMFVVRRSSFRGAIK